LSVSTQAEGIVVLELVGELANWVAQLAVVNLKEVLTLNNAIHEAHIAWVLDWHLHQGGDNSKRII